MNAVNDYPEGITRYDEFFLHLPVYFPAGHAECRYCRFCRHNDAFNTFRCSITENYVFDVLKGGRAEDCPLTSAEDEAKQKIKFELVDGCDSISVYDIRQSLHMNQVDFADAVGIAVNTVRRCESGKYPVSAKTYKKICRYLERIGK